MRTNPKCNLHECWPKIFLFVAEVVDWMACHNPLIMKMHLVLLFHGVNVSPFISVSDLPVLIRNFGVCIHRLVDQHGIPSCCQEIILQ